MSKKPSNDPFDEQSSIHVAQMVLAAVNLDKFGGRSDAFSQFLAMYHRHGFVGSAMNHKRRLCHASRELKRVGSLMMLFLKRAKARFQYRFGISIIL